MLVSLFDDRPARETGTFRVSLRLESAKVAVREKKRNVPVSR